MWIATAQIPLTQETAIEVIGFHPDWIDEDFNPNGTRVGFIDGEGEFTCAKWCNTHDCYETVDTFSEDTIQIMPTHYMFIPKHP